MLQVAACEAALVGASALVAFTTRGGGVRLFGSLMLGPFSGWWLAALDGSLAAGAVLVLMPMTGLCLCAVAAYAVTPTWRRAAVATSLWFAVGWFFCVGIWV